MEAKTKRIVAREFLLFIIPLLILSITMFITHIILHNESSDLHDREWQVKEQISHLTDSLKEVSLQELNHLVSALEAKNTPLSKIERVKSIVYSKDYTLEPLTDIYGEPVEIPYKLISERTSVRQAQSKNNYFRNAFFGDGYFLGWFILGYIFWLIFIYPLRFLFLSIKWAVRTLKSS